MYQRLTACLLIVALALLAGCDDSNSGSATPGVSDDAACYDKYGNYQGPTGECP